MQYHENAKRIEPKVEIKGAAQLYTDKQRLSEIMRNLISNAIIYTSKKRRNPYVHIKVKITQKKCSISVEDNGVGIKKSFQKDIFKMFFRANDKVSGSGIGLYIVEQSVNKLGGSIEVESKLHVGTKFQIVLPNNNPV